MNATAEAVARLLDDDGRCPPADPPDGRWQEWRGVPIWHVRRISPVAAPAGIARHRHVPSTSGRGATSPRRPAPGTAP